MGARDLRDDFDKWPSLVWGKQCLLACSDVLDENLQYTWKGHMSARGMVETWGSGSPWPHFSALDTHTHIRPWPMNSVSDSEVGNPPSFSRFLSLCKVQRLQKLKEGACISMCGSIYAFDSPTKIFLSARSRLNQEDRANVWGTIS